MPREIQGLFGMRRLFLIGDAHVMNFMVRKSTKIYRKVVFRPMFYAFNLEKSNKTMPTLMSLLQQLADFKA
jgi:hypothetical protein